MKKRGIILLIIFAVVILLVAVYFSFFFSYKCNDLSCFRAHQEDCSRTKYIYDSTETTWDYHILGDKEGKCMIEVTALQVKEGSFDRVNLQGKTMICYLPLQDISFPESDISRCHGILKEELQDLIIQKLHDYIIEGVGDIGESLEQTI